MASIDQQEKNTESKEASPDQPGGIITSVALTEKDIFLKNLREDFVRDSIKILTDAAKQIVSIIPIIISISAFGIGYVKAKYAGADISIIEKIAAVTGISLILSLAFSMISIIPSMISFDIFDLEDIEGVVTARIRKKYIFVIVSYFFLIVSLALLLVLCIKMVRT